MARCRASRTEETLFPLHHHPPNREGPVGRHIKRALSARFAPATRAMEHALARTTVADMLHNVQARSV